MLAPKAGNARAVKVEFLVGLALLLLAPIGNKDLKFDTGYVKRLVAYALLFMLLFPMSQARNPGVSRTASAVGGLFLLTMVVYSPTKGFAVDFVKLINTVIAKLQPKMASA
ncbi:hypothetical protein ACFWY9_30565 [Amycolatopsis sp. NPDC059027]|uniref:hypothetical protein n=1 Tax=Amycolatopsis sp. NPDC059027 TaxID=3346709 RepID=UPI00366CEC2C